MKKFKINLIFYLFFIINNNLINWKIEMQEIRLILIFYVCLISQNYVVADEKWHQLVQLLRFAIETIVKKDVKQPYTFIFFLIHLFKKFGSGKTKSVQHSPCLPYFTVEIWPLVRDK